MSVEIIRASLVEKPLVAALMHPYLRELDTLSGHHVPGTEYGPDQYFNEYWKDPSRFAFLIKSDGKIVGFCLVRRLEPGRFAIAEFYIAPSARKNGFGRAAALSIFEQFPGHWQVAQSDGNLPAQAFWREVISDFTDGNFEETRSDAAPVGPMQVFASRHLDN